MNRHDGAAEEIVMARWALTNVRRVGRPLNDLLTAIWTERSAHRAVRRNLSVAKTSRLSRRRVRPRLLVHPPIDRLRTVLVDNVRGHDARRVRRSRVRRRERW